MQIIHSRFDVWDRVTNLAPLFNGKGERIPIEQEWWVWQIDWSPDERSFGYILINEKGLIPRRIPINNGAHRHIWERELIRIRENRHE